MASAQSRLVVMDDEAGICSLIEKVGVRMGFETKSCTEPLKFIDIVKGFVPAVVVIDLKMPGCDGVELLQALKETGCRAQIIVISGMDQRVLSTAERLGRSHGLKMLGVLQKPIKLPELQSLLTNATGAGRSFGRDELEAAIVGDELIVHYQPKIAYEHGAWAIDGAEALVRWQHPTHGLVMPGEFLALAEDSGLIGCLTEHVVRTCVYQVSTWRKRGVDVKVAVNLSAHLTEDLDFPTRLRQLLTEHEVPGSSFVLELTETAAMADPSKAMDILLRLRVSDIGLSIDDFGTGFSSLKQLYQLPFDELKIDRTFVRGLPGDEEARTIVKATIEMAHALNMTVCAEGVETRSALEYLESIRCDHAQGYFISRPVSAAEFEQLVGPWSNLTLRHAVSAEP
jgi:EAL domain-containing protein (putative c-di-GMP-specific phosphodiesterase class I)/CheY-like chemotaxis protein